MPYKQLISNLLHLVSTNRPDIAFSCSQISLHMQHPFRKHWSATKYVLRYLSGTKDYGIVFDKNGTKLKDYSDSNFAAPVDDRKSTNGYVFLNSGGAVSWRSKSKMLSPIRQRKLSLSHLVMLSGSHCG